MLDSKIDIEKLKHTIKLLRKKVKEQKELIADYQNNWMINLFNSLEAITNEYSILLNPPPQKIKASFKNQSELFEVKIAETVGVFSDGRTKMIFLTEKINSLGSNERNTNLILKESEFEPLLKSLDSIKLHLCQVDKSYFVNVKYYNLKQDEIICNIEVANEKFTYQRIEINKKYKANFIEMKTNFDKIYSLQKVLVDYKLKNGLPI
jgi:hypothetical protein